MKIAATALVLLSLASPALAISRYNALDRSCGAVQQSIASEKAVLLRYPSHDGKITLYDRYVINTAQCGAGHYAQQTSVPTQDNPSCPVFNCRSSSMLQPR